MCKVEYNILNVSIECGRWHTCRQHKANIAYIWHRKVADNIHKNADDIQTVADDIHSLLYQNLSESLI